MLIRSLVPVNEVRQLLLYIQILDRVTAMKYWNTQGKRIELYQAQRA